MPNDTMDVSLHIEIHQPDGGPLQGTVDVDCEHQTLTDHRQFKGLDGSKTIEISGLNRTPQGLYKVTVTPSARFAPQGQFVNIPASGYATLTYIFKPDGASQGGGSSMSDGKAKAGASPLTNSQRRIYKATYRPLSIPQVTNTGRFLEKLAFVRGLDIHPQEFAQVQSGGVPNVPLIEAVKQLTAAPTLAVVKSYGPTLANTSPEDLIQLAERVGKTRAAAAADARQKLREIQDRCQAAQPAAPAEGAPTPPMAASTGGPGGIVSTPSPAAPVTLSAAVEWAKAQALPVYQQLRDVAMDLHPPLQGGLAPETTAMAPAAVSATEISTLPERLDYLSSLPGYLIPAFQVQTRTEPVGQLHLERIEMTPAGVEHGELVHSVPLTPKETVNITHREWSVVTKTFETIVQDSFEGFSETGVSEKTDLAQATDNETKHSSSLDVNGSVSATYNGLAFSVTAASSVDYRQQTDSTQIEKNSVTHSMAVTRNASTRTKKEHKMSFRVSSVAGAEDLSVRTITNPSDTNAMRVDYFQLLRKWQVELVRYGLRLTYDIVIPNPGLDLIGRTLEVQAIDEMLTTAAYSFNLDLSAINEKTCAELSLLYGVALDPPPADAPEFELHKEFKTDDSVKDKWFADVFEFETGDDYTVDEAKFIYDIATTYTKIPAFLIVDGTNVGLAPDCTLTYGTLPLPVFKGESGKMAVQYEYIGLYVFTTKLHVKMKLSDKAYQAWQVKCWTTLRDAYKAAFDKQLERAKDRKAYLEAQIAGFDALTLRKMEREEIMRWVLRWLLGPGFDLMPSTIQALFRSYPPYNTAPYNYKAPALAADGSADPFNAFVDVNDLSYADWQTIKQYGDLIRLIHDAVEWENVLFFAYPYFWDSIKNWPFKRFLVHPDPIHREFLRSGAMRVVLTIRPGFEDAFVNLQLGYAQISDHPYITIADDIRNFAMTNYEGIPPANPDNNVRPLLYPEQRRAWNDMQKLIGMIEEYNSKRHLRTVASAVAAGTQTVTPSSMDGIEYGTKLIFDPPPADGETVTVTATSKNTFTAVFQNSYPAGVTFQIDPALPMYPATSEFPATIVAFAGNTKLPLTDPWGNPYHYTSPGLNADYDLVCYGADGVADQDQTDPVKRANPLNRDITNYAEGSIVGRWYEYTPTGALDVAINTVLPTTPQAE